MKTFKPTRRCLPGSTLRPPASSKARSRGLIPERYSTRNPPNATPRALKRQVSFVVKDWIPEDSSATASKWKRSKIIQSTARTSESAIFRGEDINDLVGLIAEARLDCAFFVILGCAGKSDLEEKIASLTSRSCKERLSIQKLERLNREHPEDPRVLELLAYANLALPEKTTDLPLFF